MANYLLCHKEFKSLGNSYIELADININKISVQIDDKKHDCTEFLKYGHSYSKKQDQTNIIVNKLGEDISIHKDDDNYYYFEYSIENKTFCKNDKLTLNILNSDRKIFCIIKDISGTKHYIDYFNNFTEFIQDISLKCETIFRYDNMKEYSSLYELFINTDSYDSLKDTIIPFFMPKMNQNMSSEKKILIHVHKNISNFDVLFTSYNNYYINNLDYNDNFHISHYKLNTNNTSNYITYSICLLYNGKDSWFII